MTDYSPDSIKSFFGFLPPGWPGLVSTVGAFLFVVGVLRDGVTFENPVAVLGFCLFFTGRAAWRPAWPFGFNYEGKVFFNSEFLPFILSTLLAAGSGIWLTKLISTK